MSDPIRHHYILVFFQKNFTKGDEKIWMHKEGKAPIYIACEEIAFENDLNTRMEKGQRNVSNETLLAQIEDLASPIIKKIIDAKSLDTLTAPEKYDFASFVILLSERNPRSFKAIDALAKQEKSDELKENIQTLSEDEILQIYKDAVAERPEAMAGVSLEEAKQLIAEGPNPENIKFSHSYGLLNMWQSAKEGTPFLLRRDWNLLIPANTSDEFILSDDPVLIVFADEKGVEIAKGGWGRKSMELLLPLSPSLLFYASYDISQIDAELDSDAMVMINGLSKESSMRYFLSGSQEPNPIP